MRARNMNVHQRKAFAVGLCAEAMDKMSLKMPVIASRMKEEELDQTLEHFKRIRVEAGNLHAEQLLKGVDDLQLREMMFKMDEGLRYAVLADDGVNDHAPS